jgi:hypothetical protein
MDGSGLTKPLDYCTYFDANYLTRGLALYRSLQRHSPPFRLWILCFDDATYDAVTRVGDAAVRPIRLADFEKDDDSLLAAKLDRSRVEYYFTCTPSLPLFVLEADPSIETITYVDADLLFYSDPTALLANREGRSVTIIPHGFPPHLRHLEDRGIYNVGLVSFRNDEAGRACLQRWRRQCLEWCYDRIEGGRFADQGYLNDWPQVLDGVVVVDDPGAGLAPWNFMRYRIDLRGDPPTVDGHRLVFYHFQAFKAHGRRLFDLGLAGLGKMPRALRIPLYGGYVDELTAARELLIKRGVQPPVGAPTGRFSQPRRVLSTLAAIARGQMLFSLGPIRF